MSTKFANETHLQNSSTQLVYISNLPNLSTTLYQSHQLNSSIKLVYLTCLQNSSTKLVFQTVYKTCFPNSSTKLVHQTCLSNSSTKLVYKTKFCKNFREFRKIFVKMHDFIHAKFCEIKNNFVKILYFVKL